MFEASWTHLFLYAALHLSQCSAHLIFSLVDSQLIVAAWQLVALSTEHYDTAACVSW